MLAATAEAGIVSNDYWTNNHNFRNKQYSVKVEEGITYGTNVTKN